MDTSIACLEQNCMQLLTLLFKKTALNGIIQGSMYEVEEDWAPMYLHSTTPIIAMGVLAMFTS